MDRLHEIKSDTLVLAAEKDRIVSKRSCEILNESIPTSTLKVFNSSHFFMLEEAPNFNLEVLNFLKQ